jgi:membrane-bound lytic murein transglycosylase F
MKTEYDGMIKEAAKRHLPEGYDWRLYKAQLFKESTLNPMAVSPVGARGIAQFMPLTWLDEKGQAGYQASDITDPEASIFTGASYMADLIKKWHWPRPKIDRYCLAMASYNAGFGNILKAQNKSGGGSLYSEIIIGLPEVTGASNSTETIQYVRRILSYYSQQITGEI